MHEAMVHGIPLHKHFSSEAMGTIKKKPRRTQNPRELFFPGHKTVLALKKT
jgi:hypothetical protein